MSLFSALMGNTIPRAKYKMFGGINAPDYKEHSLRSRIMTMPLPGSLFLNVALAELNNSEVLFRPGDRVLKFQPLTESASLQDIIIHAPSSGIIRSITTSGNEGALALTIEIECDGRDEAFESDSLTAVDDYRALSLATLLERIRLAGISGLGGAGFPTAVKLKLAAESNTEVLIINAAECEPYISADEALIRENANEVVMGAEILQAISLAPRCVIAIEDNKRDAIDALLIALKQSSIELLRLKNKYPAGGEKQIIQAVTGKLVPSNAYPKDIAVLVQNAGTAFASYKAIVQGQPCISRVTTLAGSPLKTPKNFEALIGTPLPYLFELCGLEANKHTGSILGGSLMGFDIDEAELAIHKTSNCLIAKSAEEFPPPKPELPCIRCGYCAQACPANLLPQQLYLYARSENNEELMEHGLSDCIECGACAYVCPSNIPLVQYYRASKESIKREDANHRQSNEWQSRFQYHQYRHKRDKDAAQERKDLNKSEANKKSEVAENGAFSREQAQSEIAAAVARVRAKKNHIHTDTKTSPKEDD